MMGVCWWCVWGWPKPIQDIYDKYKQELGDDVALLYGPAHIVWADENWDSVDWCLENFDTWVKDWNDNQYQTDELEIVRKSLLELKSLPDEFKEEPAGFDFDESDPNDFPPPDDWVMVGGVRTWPEASDEEAETK